MSLLQVSRLSLSLPDGRRIVDELSFSLDRGGALAIVGESGSGKTQAALALIGLQAPAMQASGSIRFDGAELLGGDADVCSGVRGRGIGFVFQDPLLALNPYARIGRQIAESIEWHRGLSRHEATAEAQRLLDAVRIADAPRRLRQYPHELSGGMRQRVMLAVALAAQPQLLIADEPTTALDVTVQQQLIALLAELRRDLGLSLLLITHDLGLVTELCERTLVLYAGQTMEAGPSARLLTQPTHPYTQALLRTRPRFDAPVDQPLPTIAGAPPDRSVLIQGCAFALRCEWVLPVCSAQAPMESAEAHGRRRCHRSVEDVQAQR